MLIGESSSLSSSWESSFTISITNDPTNHEYPWNMKIIDHGTTTSRRRLPEQQEQLGADGTPVVNKQAAEDQATEQVDNPPGSGPETTPALRDQKAEAGDAPTLDADAKPLEPTGADLPQSEPQEGMDVFNA